MKDELKEQNIEVIWSSKYDIININKSDRNPKEYSHSTTIGDSTTNIIVDLDHDKELIGIEIHDVKSHFKDLINETKKDLLKDLLKDFMKYWDDVTKNQPNILHSTNMKMSRSYVKDVIEFYIKARVN